MQTSSTQLEPRALARDITTDDVDTQDFWDRVAVTVDVTECWLWTGNLDFEGYPRYKRQGRHIRAHRVMYVLTHGTIDSTQTVDHLCRVKQCVNPAHLEMVSNQENAARARAAMWAARGGRCRNGHDPSEIRYKGAVARCAGCGREAAARQRMGASK